MRCLLVVVLLACGSKQTPSHDPPPPPPDHRTPIEKRRDAACDTLAPVLTDCAVADAKATMTPEAYAKLNPEELRGKHRQEFLKACKVDMSSRQVRVLEVCFRAETQCGPLAECLANLAPAKQ